MKNYVTSLEGKVDGAAKPVESNVDLTSEKPIVETKERGAEQLETQQTEMEAKVEREKTPEETLVERHQLLLEQAKVITRTSKELSGVDRVLTFGIDVLMQKYGVEKVVDAIKSAATADAYGEIGGQLGVVINTLEPSAEARNTLYKELRAAGDTLIKQGKEEFTTLTGGRPSRHLVKGHLGRSRQVIVDSLQRFDDLKGNLGFLSSEWRDRAIRLFTSNASRFSVTNGLATEFNQRYEGDWDAMKSRFEGSKDDLFGLYDKLSDESDELTEHFGGEKEVLLQDIREEIIRKESDARQVFEQTLVAQMGDLNQIRESAMKTEAGQQLIESAILAMEKQIAEMTAKMDTEVAKSTQQLRSLLNNTERLQSYQM